MASVMVAVFFLRMVKVILIQDYLKNKTDND